jgi:cytochrome P450
VDPALSSLDLITPDSYGESGYPHEAWTRLRREAPVCRMQTEGFEPYWAITRHADIRDISTQPTLFLNAPTMQVPRIGMPNPQPGRTIVNMDPPDHRIFRKPGVDYFTARNVARLAARIEEITTELLDGIANEGEESECDFVETVAAWLPLKAIAELLGVPEQDHAHILELTNRVLGGTDPEFQDEGGGPGGAMMQFLQYMAQLAMKSREDPREDLGSYLGQCEIEGQPMPEFELVSYYVAMATAGHDTTRNALSGGLLALIEHPEEFERLQSDPGLLDLAVEEILRWTTPVVNFTRTAARDTQFRGHAMTEGDRVTLFYPSANRDEAVFEDPFRFRLDRSPNPHLAFGIGEHFCIGAKLARLEIRTLLAQLVDRMSHVELAGPVERLRASFVAGPKHMPIRYRLLPSKEGARS